MPIERDRILAPRGISRLPEPVGDSDAATKKYVDDNIGGGGAVATDVIWDVKGDLAVGTGSNTAIVLAVGPNGYTLVADSTTATGLKWAAASGDDTIGWVL